MINRNPEIIIKENEDENSFQNTGSNEVKIHILSPTNTSSPSSTSESDSLSPQSAREEQEFKKRMTPETETRQLLSPNQIQSPTDESNAFNDVKIEIKTSNQTGSVDDQPATENKSTRFNPANSLHQNKIARNAVYLVNGIFGGISTPLSATGALGGVSVAPILIVGVALTGAYAMWQAASSYRTANKLDNDIENHKNSLTNLGANADIEAKEAKKYAQHKRTKTSGIMTMVSNGTSYGSAMGTLSSLVTVPMYGIATLVGVGAMSGYLSKVGIDNTKHEAEYLENRIKTLQEEQQKAKNNEISNLKLEKVTLEQETNSLKIELAKKTREAMEEKQARLKTQKDLQQLKKESLAQIEELKQVIATLKKETEEKTPAAKNKETTTSTENIGVARNINSFAKLMSKEGQPQTALPVVSSSSSSSSTATATHNTNTTS